MTVIRPLLLYLALAGIAPAQAEGDAAFVLTGTLQHRGIIEASGLQAGTGGAFYVHNDEKRDVFVIDATGKHLGAFKLDGAKNRDWEDIARVPHDGGHLLVIADVGDNAEKRKDVDLWFFEEPQAGDYNHDRKVFHRLQFSYPDGPRDVESVAWDPSSDQLLLLSKRDTPPRLYGIPLQDALREKQLVAAFLAEVPGFRPPTPADFLVNPKRGFWVSQPTGLDISPDGRTAAVITYRSLYLFRRDAGESWAQAFRKMPEEFMGPPGYHDEAVCFSLDGRSVYVTTEGRPAPLHRLDLPDTR